MHVLDFVMVYQRSSENRKVRHLACTFATWRTTHALRVVVSRYGDTKAVSDIRTRGLDARRKQTLSRVGTGRSSMAMSLGMVDTCLCMLLSLLKNMKF